MLCRERSFSRLCRLIKEAPDDDDTAAELNELLNDLTVRYSELTVLRALTAKLNRAGNETRPPRRQTMKTVPARRNRKQQAREPAEAEATERKVNKSGEQHLDSLCDVSTATVLEFRRSRRADDAVLASVS
jgi:hypothetical protein